MLMAHRLNFVRPLAYQPRWPNAKWVVRELESYGITMLVCSIGAILIETIMFGEGWMPVLALLVVANVTFWLFFGPATAILGEYAKRLWFASVHTSIPKKETEATRKSIALFQEEFDDVKGLICNHVVINQRILEMLTEAAGQSFILDAHVKQRRSSASDLHNALSREEFRLYYQAEVNLQDGLVQGFEALLRWHSPTRGLVLPSEFLPLAEQLNLMGDITDWVLRQACRAATKWPTGISIAINASPSQLQASGFADSVSRALAESGLSGARLEIEVAEHLLRPDEGAMLSTSEALHALGVRLVLDNYGSAYSSFSQLKYFNKIKIDRRLIADLHIKQAQAVLSAIAALGRSRDMVTTAQGVETAEQLDRCLESGCTSVQGYYISRPIPEEELPALLTRLTNAATLRARAS